MANLITLSRTFLAVIVILLVSKNKSFNEVSIFLIILLMLFDILDGTIARYLGKATIQGSVWDILADRIIENIFFIYYASLSFFNIWIPILIMVRGFTVDAIRTIYLMHGKTAFGVNTLHNKKWTKFLVCSDFSRGMYNSFKMLTFVFFAALIEPHSNIFNYINFDTISLSAYFCLWITIIMSLIRAFPVLYDGWSIQKYHDIKLF